MSLNDGMFASEFDDWNTPLEVLAPVREFNDGEQIACDPCSNAQSIVNARVEYRLERGEDGLVLSWFHGGLVFFNPPYGDEIAAFMRRANKLSNKGLEAVALVPNRSDTAWYQDNISNVAAKCEWRGRLVHPRGVADQRQASLFAASLFGPGRVAVVPESGTAPFPSALLYWGHRARRFAEVFARFGKVWR
jgi:hypothetical protein